MKSIVIGNQTLIIKDYYCSNGSGYVSRDDGRLWLYVDLTDQCNARCPFCINPCRNDGRNPFRIEQFRAILPGIAQHIYGVSVTGGEPMLTPELLDDVLSTITDVFGHSVEIDIATNGTNIAMIPELRRLPAIDTIHISRHRIDDDENRQLMGFGAPSAVMLKDMIQRLSDPGKIVLNCILMNDGIDSASKMADYLDFAASIGVQNTSFIGMSICNPYCSAHYIDPASIDLSTDPRFHVWNRYQDHDYCSCSSGHYDAPSGTTRFYYRSMGTGKAPYARQLVYTADNRLLAGFNGMEIQL